MRPPKSGAVMGALVVRAVPVAKGLAQSSAVSWQVLVAGAAAIAIRLAIDWLMTVQLHHCAVALQILDLCRALGSNRAAVSRNGAGQEWLPLLP